MKKNVLRKDFFMEIKKTKGRFISIFFIVMLGVAFYSGIRSSEPSMRLSGDAYFDRSNLCDIKVMGTMGLTQDDIDAIRAVDGIEDVEGGYSLDLLCPTGDTQKVVHMMSTQDDFNDIYVKEGRLPSKPGECLLDEDFLVEQKYEVGDVITFKTGDADKPLSDTLVTDTFKVVGIGNSPLYISFGRGSSMIGNGSVSGFVAVAPESFDMDVYTEAYVRVDEAMDTVAFTTEYEGLTDEALDALEKIQGERCKIRREEIVGEVSEELEDAEDEIDDKSTELEDARTELEDARTKAQKEMGAARGKLDRGQSALESSKTQIDEGETQIQSAKESIAQQQSVIDQGRRDLEAGQEELLLKRVELEAGERQYNAIYEPAMKGFEESQKLIDESRADLDTAYEEAEQEMAEVDTKLAQYQPLLDEVTELEAIVEEEKAWLDSAKEEHERILGKQLSGQSLTDEETAFMTEYEECAKRYSEDSSSLNEKKLSTDYATAQSLLASKSLIQETLNGLTSSYEELDAKQEVLDQGKEEFLAQGQQIEDGKAQIAAAQAQIDAAQTQLDEGQQQLNIVNEIIRQKEIELIIGKVEYSQGERELIEGESEYAIAAADALSQIEEGEAQIASGEEQLIEARQDIADAQAEIDKVENPKWFIQDRDDALPDYSGYGENADRMRSIGHVFPVLFFLVAALISLTSMTRMVEEQRVQIGTMKALGYDKFMIAKKYIYYALLATVGGSVLGFLAGEKIFPFIIIYAYKIMYQHLPDILVPYHLSYALQATLIAVCCTLFATIFSCFKELQAQPASLMRPPSPKQGKRILLERIGWFWKRLSFTWKSSIRNMIRYKKRFFMTIFGIGGCMALMVVGFGLKDCIYEITELQYGKIQSYEATAFMEDNLPREERNEILDSMENDPDVDDYMEARMLLVKAKTKAGEGDVYLMAPKSEEEIGNFIHFGERIGKETYNLTDNKVILTEKMAKTLRVKPGDNITIEDDDFGDRELTVEAVCENYLGHYLYVSPQVYEELYDAPPRCNSILYKAKGGSQEKVEEIGTRLLGYDHVLNVSYSSSLEERLDDMLKSLDLVIVVLIVSAGMLAFVVLYNLNNININERKRELATLKVLGFYDMEVASYVYRENIMLTLLGSLAGMGLGNILHRFVILTVEVNEAMFGRQIHGMSYLYSFLFTVGFSLFVNFVMFYKLKKIDMVESLKSVE